MIRQELANKIAAQRLAKAEWCREAARLHGSGKWADTYRKEAEAHQEAAKQALNGDLEPVKI